MADDSLARDQRLSQYPCALGNIDPLTVAAVIDKHLQPLEECIRAMLPRN